MLFLVWKNEEMTQKQLRHLYLSLLVVQCLMRFYIHLLECNTCTEGFEVSRKHLHNSKVFKVLKQDCYGLFFPSTVLQKQTFKAVLQEDNCQGKSTFCYIYSSLENKFNMTEEVNESTQKNDCFSLNKYNFCKFST